MSETLTIEADRVDDRAWHASWLLSTIWLVFLALPLLALWTGDDLSDGRRIAGTVILAAFGVAYTIAFRDTARRESFASPPEVEPKATRALAVLISLTVVGFAVGSWGMLGMVPFIPAYAVFNTAWRTSLVVLAGSLLAVTAFPIAGGVYEDLWPITPAVVTAGLATGLGRLTEERSAERTALRTELLLSDDRNRVARDVHDVLGHSLTAVVVKAELTERLLERVEAATEADRATLDRCRTELSELRGLSRHALAEIRSTVGGLRNPNLTDEVVSARTVLADADVTCTTLGDVEAVPERARIAVAWVVREAVTNVVRHAEASHCTIHVGPAHDVWLRIDDDGVGPDGVEDGNGITGLRERLALLDARLSIAPAPDGGTMVEVRHG